MSENIFDSIPEAESAKILERAKARGADEGAAYAGEIFPDEAWELVRRGDAILVDVRTPQELSNVGAVPGAPNVVWAHAPAMTPNPNFVQDLSKEAKPSDNVLLLCRSARRSVSAANVLADAGCPTRSTCWKASKDRAPTAGSRGDCPRRWIESSHGAVGFDTAAFRRHSANGAL